MPKLATGVDLVEIDRVQNIIEQHQDRFLERVFTPRELQEVGDNYASLAARFAAKEAVAKALGSGIGSVAWKEIEILRGLEREPLLHLHGEAKRLSEVLNLKHWSVSLSHTYGHAIAFVVALGD